MTVSDRSIDEYRPIKVVCIGAGISGILAAIRFPQKVPNIHLTVYEKEKGIGGTWLLNKYPGIACDIPSHGYQFSFERNINWSSFYSPGAEILAYLEGVVEKYKLMPYIKLEHELTHASWDHAAGKWNLQIRHGDAEFADTADVLFLGVGILHRWAWPDIPGLRDFGGRLLHSAQWDVSDGTWEKDWGDKAVGVVGNGSSGIQIVAALQPRVKSIVNYARSKTWIGLPFGFDFLLKSSGQDAETTDYLHSDKEREAFKDPETYKEFIHSVDTSLNSYSQIVERDSDLQNFARTHLRAQMEKKLASRPGLLEKIASQFPVLCRRLTPAPGYLEALCAENATYETTPIARVTPKGIKLEDGRTQELDVLVCATGFDVSYRFPFPIIGCDGVSLNSRWGNAAEAYLTLVVDGFPNMFFAGGPNTGVSSGSLIATYERQITYVVGATLKLQQERLECMEVKRAAMDDWRAYMEAYFPKTVYSGACSSSWYKNKEGRVIGLWPGSCLHALRTLANPRWEDFEYEHLDGPNTNRLAWLGDGLTCSEKTKTGDLAWYLDESEVDHPPVPE